MSELKDRWRWQLKFTTISTYYDFVEEKNSSLERAKEADLKGEEYKPSENEKLSLAELEEKARNSTKNSFTAADAEWFLLQRKHCNFFLRKNNCGVTKQHRKRHKRLSFVQNM